MRINKIIVFAFCIALMFQAVYGLAITPAGKTIHFDSNKTIKGSFEVFNDKDVEISVGGFFKDRISVDKTNIDFSDKKKETVNYELKLPKYLDGGWYVSTIQVHEKNPVNFFGKTEIKVVPSLIYTIKVFAPYNKKKIEIENLEIINPHSKEVSTFRIAVKNIGKEAIKKLKGKIYIKNNGKTAVELDTNKIKNFEINKRAILEAKWIPNLAPGNYDIEAVVNYDGFEMKKSTNFKLGKMIIKVLDIKSNNYELGKNIPIEILLKSDWNSIIKDVSCVVTFSTDKYAETFTTGKIDLQPGVISSAKGIWNSKNAKPGKYNVYVNVYAMDQNFEKVFEVNVGKNKLGLLKQLTGAYVKAGESKKNDLITAISFGIIFVFVALNLAWFLYYKKKRYLKK